MSTGITLPQGQLYVNGYKRYQAAGFDGLKDQNKKPRSSLNKKVNQEIEKWIINLRSDGKLV